jgi:hypothetical protein
LANSNKSLWNNAITWQNPSKIALSALLLLKAVPERYWAWLGEWLTWTCS